VKKLVNYERGEFINYKKTNLRLTKIKK
jgi:hypothetical protein